MSETEAAIVIATIAAVGSGVSAYFSRQAKNRVGTTNGHTLGELGEAINDKVDRLDDRTGRLESWLVEHLATHGDGKRR